MTIEDAVRSEPGKTVVRFHVSPGSSNPGFGGYDPWRESIRVRIGSPARKGAANEELIAFLSKSFGIDRSKLEIVSGEKERSKSISIHGMSREGVLEALEELLGEG